MKDKALILDFGGVISKTLFETHNITEAALNLPEGSLTWQGPFDPDHDPLWVSMQNDEITEREYWATRTREVSVLSGHDWTEMSAFVKAARGADPDLIIREQARDAIQRVKKAGGKLAILSNELDLFYGAQLRQRLSIIKDFDVIIDATYTRILKPDPAAYQLCLDELGLPAEHCVFLDDQQRNVTGASNVGMIAVQFDVKNPSASYEQALSLLADA